eukprot:1180843-Alexandrium_andersonii.AAC.1
MCHECSARCCITGARRGKDSGGAPGASEELQRAEAPGELWRPFERSGGLLRARMRSGALWRAPKKVRKAPESSGVGRWLR